MQLDHIIIATTDLDESARRLADTTGLVAVEGGTHDGLGTHNYIVPLGRGYLELVAAHDRELAKDNPFGRLVLAALADADEAFAGWAVEVAAAELETRAQNSDEPMGRLTRRGIGIHHLGMARAIASPGLPFLLARDPGSQNPEKMPAAHDSTLTGVRALSIAESQSDLDNWLTTTAVSRDPRCPVVCAGTGAGITQVDIATARGGFTLTDTAPTRGTHG